ncbi:MAG: outer membrane beta-barrel protein [Tannerella sp.]|nr:outer membrane beta-barrel protein [Tannerella sp.]
MFLLLISMQGVIAQVEVRGNVTEKAGNKEPIEQAAIRLLNLKDSTLINGVVSTKDGFFAIKNVKTGRYLLNVSFIGYASIYQMLEITGKVNPVNVGKLEMEEDAIMLGEAVVTAKAVEVTVRNDTIEYNADSYKVAEGSVLEDVLKKMPGVEIDSDGKVTVNGKEVKKIMVDSKEFFSSDPKVATKNLPAKMVDKVQVLDKKSDMAMMTGFDDGDEETIINLTVKPGMKQGWFGNAYGGLGNKERYDGNFMVNRFINNDQFTIMGGANNTNNMGFSDMAGAMFGGMGGGRGGFGGGGGNGITSSGNIGTNFSKEFSPKLVAGGNIRYSHSDNDTESMNDTEYILSRDSSSYDHSENKRNTLSNNIGADFRMEWKLDTLTQLIFQPSFSYSQTNSREDINSYSLDNQQDSINSSRSAALSDGEGYNASARLEISRKLNDKGRVLSGSISGGYNDTYSNGVNNSNTKYFMFADSSDIIDQKVRYDNSGYNYRAYASWVEPLGRNNFLQATYRISQNKRESLKNSFNSDATGNYTVLDSTYSKSTRNSAVEQRASIAFKAVREKYNYTIGFNVDPSYSKTETFVGDNTLYSMSRHVTNFSPTAQLNYRFDKRSNLRIDYDGRTTQPSMSQLQPVADISDPLNTTIGNPELKPTYTNELRIRYQQFVPESQSAFMIMANGNYILNAVVNKSIFDANTHKRITTYENVNGNYNGNARIIFNRPLKNKKFSINSMSFLTYSEANGFINDKKNTNTGISLSERAGINFRSTYLDLGLNGNIRYNKTKNSLQEQNDLTTYNYGGGASTTIYLPYNFQIESDINYSTNSGYAEGYQQEELLWNASASKAFLKNNSGTLKFKIYDILRDRSNISFTSTDNTMRYSEYNTLTSYFIVSFIYRFSIFSGGASASDVRRPGPGGGDGQQRGEGRSFGTPSGGGGGRPPF